MAPLLILPPASLDAIISPEVALAASRDINATRLTAPPPTVELSPEARDLLVRTIEAVSFLLWHFWHTIDNRKDKAQKYANKLAEYRAAGGILAVRGFFLQLFLWVSSSSRIPPVGLTLFRN